MVVLSQTSIGGSGNDLGFTNPVTVTIATTEDEENLTKPLKVNTFALTSEKKEKDTNSEDYGSKDSKILDLIRAEKRITIDGWLVNYLNGFTTLTTSSTGIGANSIDVTSTTGFDNSGTADIGSDTITYSGKTFTTLTGVSGVTKVHGVSSSVISSKDSHSLAQDKKSDLKKIFLGGGVINMLYEGEVFTVNMDKLSIKRERHDGLTGDDGIGEFSIKLTAIKGINLIGN